MVPKMIRQKNLLQNFYKFGQVIFLYWFFFDYFLKQAQFWIDLINWNDIAQKFHDTMNSDC